MMDCRWFKRIKCPIAVAMDKMGRPDMVMVVKLSALTSLASVLLANAYGHHASVSPSPPIACCRHCSVGVTRATAVFG